MASAEEELPPGDPAPEILEDRLWVDGCWDFFHHGESHCHPSFPSKDVLGY